MTPNFQTIDAAGALAGKRIFTAIDLNVPIVGGKVADDYRIVRAKPTLDFLSARGARTLLVSHQTHASDSLFPVYECLKQDYPLIFADTVAVARAALEKAVHGSFVLLENVRRFAGEEANDAVFARELASLTAVYVNEAFSASHRAHASIVGVPKHLPHYAGFLFAEEVVRLSHAFTPTTPSLVILGGAKFETKLPLVAKFLSTADTVYVCGALANDFFRTRGEEVGESLVSRVPMSGTVVNHPHLVLPADVVWKGQKIVDAGARAVAELLALIAGARFVLWNGPMGQYEYGYGETTAEVARALSASSAETIVGGGDTLAAISRLGLLEKFSFVSTGGGAMLQFLANETLPGLEALTARP